MLIQSQKVIHMQSIVDLRDQSRGESRRIKAVECCTKSLHRKARGKDDNTRSQKVVHSHRLPTASPPTCVEEFATMASDMGPLNCLNLKIGGKVSRYFVHH